MKQPPYGLEISPVASLDLGGYRAPRLGVKRAEKLHGISLHSVITGIREKPRFSTLLPNDGAYEPDILDWIDQNRSPLPPLCLDCSTSDELIEGDRHFHSEPLTESTPSIL